MNFRNISLNFSSSFETLKIYASMYQLKFLVNNAYENAKILLVVNNLELFFLLVSLRLFQPEICFIQILLYVASNEHILYLC